MSMLMFIITIFISMEKIIFIAFCKIRINTKQNEMKWNQTKLYSLIRDSKKS